MNPKITMPVMPRSYPRERLCTYLDEISSCPVIWLSAPAGYGKTTAISNYLRARERPTIWYQCDELDADIASFFHYMAVARQQFSAARDGFLPAFQIQYFAAIPTFTRNFFRSWFTGLPASTTLVLDDWQEVPADSALPGVLPIIAAEVPQGVTMVIISRTDPAANMGRLSAIGRLVVVDFERLQLSRAETAAVVRLHESSPKPTASTDIDRLYAMTQGWAVGLTLMLRQDVPRAPATVVATPDSSRAVFDYLAAEVFDRLDQAVQNFLIETSCLEHVSVPVAQRVCGNSNAAKILDTLARQNAFTLYRPAANSYYYHPLFRSFLRNRFQALHSLTEQREWLVHSATCLCSEGDSEAGVALLLQAQSWEQAASLIRRIAEGLVQQARVQTLLGWIEALPSQMCASDSWLTYWRGVCQLTTAFGCARKTLERAYATFLAADNRLGQMLACAAILQHITYCYADYRAMLPWIAALERLLSGAHEFPSAGVELQVKAGFMLALSQALPQHRSLAQTVERLSQLLDSELSLASRAEGVAALLHFFSRFGRTAQYGNLDDQVVEILNDSRLQPANRLQLMWLQAYRLHQAGEPGRVLEILGAARALARHEGLVGEDCRMRVCELQAQEWDHATAAAIVTFSELEPLIRSGPPIPLAHFLYVRAMFELACGRTREALKYGEEAIPMIRACHWRIGEALALTGMAEIYCAVGRFADALQCIGDCREIAAGVAAPLLEFNTRLVRAEIARHTCTTQEFTDELARAFCVGREQGYANTFHTASPLLKNLLPHALSLGIEGSYCRWVIRKRKLKPPSAALLQWPWAIRIRAMGRFEVTVNDAPLTFARKAQRKPLDLLKALVSHRQGLEIWRLMDLLWPDLEGDSARNALDLALHRLRKMLNSKDAVVLSDGRAMLSCDEVWADTFALACFRTEDLSVQELTSAVAELLELYRAPLLSGEECATIGAIDRERLRSQFVRHVGNLSDRLAAAGLWTTLTLLCAGAIEREPFEERFQREIIRGLLAQGKRAEAELALQRHQQFLAQAIELKRPRGARLPKMAALSRRH